MAENSNSSAKNLSDLGKRSSSITGINKILDENDSQQSQSSSSNQSGDTLADDFMKQLDSADNSSSIDTTTDSDQTSDSSSNSTDDTSQDKSSSNSTNESSQSDVKVDKSNSQSSDKSASSITKSDTNTKAQPSNTSDNDTSNNNEDEDNNNSDNSGDDGVNPSLQQELAGEAEEEEAKQLVGQAQQQHQTETGADVENSDKASSSDSSNNSDKAESSVKSSSTSSNSSSSSNSNNNQTSQRASNTKVNTKDNKAPNITKQISLKEYHSFDTGLQRAYVYHKKMMKDIKQLQKHYTQKQSVSQDVKDLIQDDGLVFQNLCNTIYTNRKNYDRHVDVVDKELQATKNKASKGADVIQQWKEEGLFANIMPYLETISDVATDPRFKQLVQKLDTKDLTPTKKLKKVSEKAEKTGKELATEKAKAGKNNNNSDK